MPTPLPFPSNFEDELESFKSEVGLGQKNFKILMLFLFSFDFIDVYFLLLLTFFTEFKPFFTLKKTSCFGSWVFSLKVMVPGQEQQLLRCISSIETQGDKKMKTNKTQAVLYLYQTLQNDGHIKKTDYMAEMEVSDLTFKRYVSELRSYLMNFSHPEELVYEKKEDYYVLRPISFHF